MSVRDQNAKTILHRGDGSLDWMDADTLDTFVYYLDRLERVTRDEDASCLIGRGLSLLRTHTELSEIDGAFDASTVDRLRDLGDHPWIRFWRDDRNPRVNLNLVGEDGRPTSL